jgi:hypothetical protein
MAEALRSVDITDAPELRRLAEEVHRTGEPRALTRDNEVLAIVVPPRPAASHRRKKTYTSADDEAFRSAAGGWKGIVDTDTFIEDVYESRRVTSSSPPLRSSTT